MPEVPFTISRVTHRDMVGGGIALIVVCAISWSALFDGSQSSQTALVGALGAVTGWLYRSGQSTLPTGTGNGTGNGNGATPENGGLAAGGGGTSAQDAPPRA